MSTPSSPDPIACARVLQDELRHVRPEIRPASDAPLDDVLRTAHAQQLSALCLSGGGIRSATFALGVIEGLCRGGLIDGLDYISTVSGGGYAGGWLSAWRYRAAAGRTPVSWPPMPAQPGGPAEPEPLIRVRRYARYLAPHMGALSVDLWALLATVARNLLLMWLVLLPIIAALLTLPYVYYAIVRAADRNLVAMSRFTLQESSTWLLLACCGLCALAIGFIARDLPSLGGRRGTQREFLVWCFAPLCLGALGLTLFWAADTVPVTFGAAIAAAAIAHPLTWAIAGMRTSRPWRPRTWMAAALSAPVAVGGMWLLANGSFGFGHPLEYDYATLAFPSVLTLVGLATVLQIGLSRDETSDEDLEWWSRFGGWLLIVIAAWIGASVVVLVAPLILRWTAREVMGLVDVPGLTVSGALGVLTSLTGGIAALATRSHQSESAVPGPVSRAVAAGTTPAFIVLLLTFLAAANLDMIAHIHTGHLAAGLSLDQVLERAWLVEAVVLLVVLLSVGLLMALFVPVNKYSLHGMYRNRLIRTFIGASRSPAERRPSPFTDFDPADDLAMASLASLPRPLHVVNATLNLVSDKSLALQQRKSESFTISPLHAGSWTLGFRPSSGYAGATGARGTGGISLGTAVTISGAAASPNMGARSTPALTFLLTLFNARLGAWLGNPGPAGGSTWQDADPRIGPAPLLRELFGLTSDRSAYVFLSDGGHFENLGLYEMVRRRCHCIIVSDAGCDPHYTFEDLSNAVRKVRIDFSIPIEFPPTGVGMDLAGQARGNPHVAIGSIKYSAVDGAADDGVLIYMKATLSGDEPADVLNYARSHAAFPHESTANQFFTEAQFESYRMLGLHTIGQVAALPVVQEMAAMGRLRSRRASLT
ncbi:MAG: hypothetical protein ACRD15_16025 [Vicinamibacterales bacterium]